MRRIAQIFQYCNRWCERCPLGHRCAINDRHSGDEEWMAGLERDLTGSGEDTSKQRDNIFSEINWEAVDKMAAGEKAAPDPSREKSELPGKELLQRADHCKAQFTEVLQGLDEQWKRLVGEDAQAGQLLTDATLMKLDNCREILKWYRSFISAKLSRALLGQEDRLDADPVQNDWNGSAKVVLIALEHCRGAGRQVLELLPESEDFILPFLAEVSALQREAKQQFPQANDFIRPGFDTLGVREDYGV